MTLSTEIREVLKHPVHYPSSNIATCQSKRHGQIQFKFNKGPVCHPDQAVPIISQTCLFSSIGT